MNHTRRGSDTRTIATLNLENPCVPKFQVTDLQGKV